MKTPASRFIFRLKRSQPSTLSLSDLTECHYRAERIKLLGQELAERRFWRRVRGDCLVALETRRVASGYALVANHLREDYLNTAHHGSLLMEGRQSLRPTDVKPEPGGWNPIIINVDDLAAEVGRLRKAELHIRNDVVSGPGGSEILLDDLSGNPVEVFQPAC